MEKLQIDYEILTYPRLQKRLESILNNPNNKFKVTKNDVIGFSASGFPIEHYSIGNGFIHVLYMGGCHGNEIISVDFVTQLMRNLALGNGVFADFDPSIYTIDFIPCQNPDGYYTTTYAIDHLTHDMNNDELEQFCKKYWVAYREDDITVTKFNNLIKDFCEKMGIIDNNKLSLLFFKKFNNTHTEITVIDLEEFFNSLNLGYGNIADVTKELWQEHFQDNDKISIVKEHQLIFKDLTFDVIPDSDENHKRLKEKLMLLYQKNKFPISTLANFYANSNGVNLNDNNPYYYRELKERIEKEGEIAAGLRENNLLKSVPGPIGTPNYDMKKPFRYEPENEALLTFLKNQARLGLNFASFNCHGTGGYLYIYPVWESDLKEAHENGTTRNFNFLINNIIASEYTKRIGEVYKAKSKSVATVKSLSYRTMGHPDRITGVGDILRKTYTAALLVELSKMGGNPIAPYGDHNNNYNLTLEANMEACMQTLKTIKRIDYLYNNLYQMHYDDDGKVVYDIIKR